MSNCMNTMQDTHIDIKALVQIPPPATSDLILSSLWRNKLRLITCGAVVMLSLCYKQSTRVGALERLAFAAPVCILLA